MLGVLSPKDLYNNKNDQPAGRKYHWTSRRHIARKVHFAERLSYFQYLAHHRRLYLRAILSCLERRDQDILLKTNKYACRYVKQQWQHYATHFSSHCKHSHSPSDNQGTVWHFLRRPVWQTCGNVEEIQRTKHGLAYLATANDTIYRCHWWKYQISNKYQDRRRLNPTHWQHFVMSAKEVSASLCQFPGENRRSPIAVKVI